MTVIEGYLLDTNIASASWDKRAQLHKVVRQCLEGLGNALIFISVVSLAEVEYGLLVSPPLSILDRPLSGIQCPATRFFKLTGTPPRPMQKFEPIFSKNTRLEIDAAG